MVKFDKSDFKTIEGYNYKKNTLEAKFIYPIAELLNEHREHHYLNLKPDAFYSNILEARNLAKKYQIIIQKHYVDFNDQFEDSGAFQELLYLQAKYKPELKQMLKELKPNLIGAKTIILVDSSNESNIKMFYKIFDDKKNMIDKKTYANLKEAIINNYGADVESILYSNTTYLPKPLRKFLEKLVDKI